MIFGQENPKEDDSVEVVRIVKYSKNWERLGHASVYGANTKTPFKLGSCRCAEDGGLRSDRRVADSWGRFIKQQPDALRASLC